MVGALFLRRTNNYKRFLSYSTVENMGIAAIGLGIGGIGVWAAVFHVVCHTLIKSSLFLQIAVVRQVYGNYRINRIGDYIHINRVGAVGLLTGMVVLVAFPPSPLFLSELMILKQTIADGRWWLVTGIMLLLCLVIYFFCSRLLRLCYQPRQDELHPSATDRALSWSAPVAARRRHRAGALAARIFPGTDRPNRIAMNYYVTDNTGASVALNDIPEVSYAAFYEDLRVKLFDARYHAAHYFALPSGDRMRFFLLLLDDAERRVLITSHATDYYDETALPSLTALHPQMHPFERDISERYGIRFDGMPWPKPLRFPAGRYDRRCSIENYPFYTMEGRSLHEVNVGPIHAGVIEPGPSASSATASRSCTSKSRWATSTGTSRRPSKRPRTACGRCALRSPSPETAPWRTPRPSPGPSRNSPAAKSRPRWSANAPRPSNSNAWPCRSPTRAPSAWTWATSWGRWLRRPCAP